MAGSPDSVELRLSRWMLRHLGPVLPRLAGAWLYRRWFRVRRTAIPAREQALLNGTEQFELAAGGKRVQAYVWPGSGPRVLLVHGWGGRAGQMAAIGANLQAAGCQVMAFDALGHGRSPGHSTSLLEIAEAIRACQAYLGGIEALVAHSYGSVCAVYADSLGLALGKLVLLAGTGEPDKRVQEFMDFYQVPAAARRDFQRRIQRHYGEDWWQRIAPLHQLAGSPRPGLLVHDRRDRIVPVAEAERLHAAWPGSRLLLTERLGHQRILSAPQVLAAVREFIL